MPASFLAPDCQGSVRSGSPVGVFDKTDEPGDAKQAVYPDSEWD